MFERTKNVFKKAYNKTCEVVSDLRAAKSLMPALTVVGALLGLLAFGADTASAQAVTQVTDISSSIDLAGVIGDFITKWAAILAVIVGGALAFTMVYLVMRRVRRIG